MKVAIIGDLHLGVAPTNLVKFDSIFESQKRFLEELLIPELKKRKIDTIIFTGDIFDQRKRIDVKIMQYVEDFFERISKKFTIYVIQGNHDTYLKDDLSITSLSLIKNKNNITVINKIQTIDINGEKILMVPWLTTALEENFIKNIEKIKGKFEYVIGHFEICGFVYEAGTVSITGLNPIDFFNTFKNTLSGHYHTNSEKQSGDSKIHYVGTPYQLTFGEVGEEKGFYIYDFETNESEYIKNELSSKFIKLKSLDDIKKYDSFDNYFIEFEYNDKMSREEVFLIEKEISSKNPIMLRTHVKEVNDIIEVDKIDNSENMSEAIISDDMIQISKVFLEAYPFNNSDMVIDIITELKSKISG